jgi:hypothetical protein
MGQRVQTYREELRELTDWEPYLKKHSGLPGARANLELVAAVVEEADADRLWRLSASSDEFLALCGTAGLGRVALMEPETVMTWLKELAADPRWRVREGVAMALQRLGREDMPKLVSEMQEWALAGPFVQRAAVAGLCEPPLLKGAEEAVEVLDILDRITKSLASSDERGSEGFRVLRQTLGYGWSVAAAAAPANARPYIEKWLRSKDKDVAWVMSSNLSKDRMQEVMKATPTKPKPAAKPTTRPAAAKAAPAKTKTVAKAKPAAKAKPTLKRKPAGKAKPKAKAKAKQEAKTAAKSKPRSRRTKR